jgi:hypothetical protein
MMVEIMGERIPERQRLLNKHCRMKIPKLYSQEEKGPEAQAVVKFFTPDGNWIWYATEFDGEDLFFGLVIGLETELGYFSLAELESVRGPLGLSIERDLHFGPTKLDELMRMHSGGGT